MRREFLQFAPPAIGDEEIDAVVAALRSGWLTHGPRARRFEEEFAAFVGAPAAVALNSCSAGLHLGLLALGVRPGDGVVTSTMTYAATANAIEQAGAVPVLADVDPVTLNLDTESARAAVRRAATAGLRVRAVVPVHYAGHPCDVGDLAREFDLVVVEDAAHALPARIGDRFVGAPLEGVRSVASFSFYANKNLTTGEGGMLTGPREPVAAARRFANQGLEGEGPVWTRDVPAPGGKALMSDVAAALGLVQWRRLPAFHERRRAIAARYTAALAGLVATPIERPGFGHAWHLYVVKLDTAALAIGRDAVVREMAARNVGTSVHFRPVHLHSWYRDRTGFRPADLPVALDAASRVLSLPIHPGMTDTDADDVAAALTDVLARHRR